MNTETNIAMLRDLFLATYNIYSWEYSAELKLKYTNYPNFEFWNQYFQRSFCYKVLTSHISFSEKPFLISDQYDLTWLILYHTADCHDAFHLLGPMFSTTPSPENLVKDFLNNGYPLSLRKMLQTLLQEIPVISVSNIMQYGTMWYYVITGQKCQAEEIMVLFYHELRQQKAAVSKLSQDNITSHSNYAFQQLYLQLVEDGNLDYKSILGTYDLLGPVGQVSLGDPVRQAKNLCIATTTLCCLSAIRGGLNPSVSYSMSDYYIQSTESCDSVSEVYSCLSAMLDDYIHRVHNTKKHLGRYSSLVTDCISYISSHLTDDITLNDLSGTLGYSEYYLSRCFKKEVGISIKNYIKKQRIQYAKRYLDSKTTNISKLSEQLHFISPSYFTKCFKEETGMTPRQYIQQPPSGELK